MAVYPLIDSPCPYKGRLSEIMQGDTCRMCSRQVHDLNTMADSERRTFLKSCQGEVCVSYKVAAGTALALTALAASAIAAPQASAQPPEAERFMVFVGGIKDGSNAVLIETKADEAIPELPIVFEPTSKPATKPATDTAKPERDQK
jgi:hypothetical protein